MALGKWLLSGSLTALLSAIALEARLLSYAPLQIPGLPQNPGVDAVNGNCPPAFPKVCPSYISFSDSLIIHCLQANSSVAQPMKLAALTDVE